MIYLDNAATTRPFDEVIEEMAAVQKEIYANPASMHSAGYAAEKKVNDALDIAKSAIGAKNGTFLFTSGGTESNNLAFFGTLKSALKRNPHIITTKIEHPSILEPLKFLESCGAEVTYLDVDERGFVSPDDVAAQVRENTKIVSVMLVNNETGAIQPISEISKKVKEKNRSILVHSDCVQGFGNVDIDVKKLGVDMLSLSAHKINGPKGVGGFYCSDRVHLTPVMMGGHQQGDMRSGTLNTPGICGFAKALELTSAQATQKRAYFAELKAQMISELSENQLFTINNIGEDYSSHIISISVKNTRAEVLLHALETYGICISAGSACASNRPAPSHVLTAMGFDKTKIEGTVRVSLGCFNTAEDISMFCEHLKKEAAALSRFIRK
ncbi:MAG: cysteine desulfurase [Clostridia bacterium]|nr:cysteine desulfurase [Clostridia bacterium]